MAWISGAILHLTQASAICAGRAMTTSIVIYRHLWLSLTTMKEPKRNRFLNAPISKAIFVAAVIGETVSFGN